LDLKDENIKKSFFRKFETDFLKLEKKISPPFLRPSLPNYLSPMVALSTTLVYQRADLITAVKKVCFIPLLSQSH
jgi:hypothetical protein